MENFMTALCEWYERLHRNGAVKVSEKGTPWKCAYHLGRALIMIVNLFEWHKMKGAENESY